MAVKAKKPPVLAERRILGKRIAQVRNELGLTTREVAERVRGVKGAAVGWWEHHGTNPKNLKKFARITTNPTETLQYLEQGGTLPKVTISMGPKATNQPHMQTTRNPLIERLAALDAKFEALNDERQQLRAAVADHVLTTVMRGLKPKLHA